MYCHVRYIYYGLTPIAQAMYPGFSRGFLENRKRKKPMYQGMAPKKKPRMNLQETKTKKTNVGLCFAQSLTRM